MRAVGRVPLAWGESAFFQFSWKYSLRLSSAYLFCFLLLDHSQIESSTLVERSHGRPLRYLFLWSAQRVAGAV